MERPPSVDKFMKNMLRQRQVSVSNGNERWVRMKKAKAARKKEAIAVE